MTSTGGTVRPDGPPAAPARRRRAATLREVAAAARVDPSTVSRALRPSTQAMVSPDTLRRVLSTAEAMGYRVNPFARGLKDQRSMTVGMILPDLANPLFPPIVRGMEDGLRRHGYAVILANTDRDATREQQHIDLMLARRVDALVLATAEREYPILKQITDLDVPVVLVNRTVDNPSVSMVSSDDHQGIGLAVRHLVELGHQDIGYVGGPTTVSTGFFRYQHFLAWTQSLGQPVSGENVVFAEWFTKDHGAIACEELLARGGHLTGIIAANDLLALGCLRALRSRGLEVPTDVSVVGYNGSRWCDEFNPPLTSVHIPKYDIGVRVAQLVIDSIEHPDGAPLSVLLPTSLQVRESTTAPRRRR